MLSSERLRSEVFKPLWLKMTALKYTIKITNINSLETYYGSKADFVEKLGTRISYVTKAEKGERKTVCGWRITYSEKYS
ncbi:hypothetical protein GPAL_3535 [Glaciecola pallidula DSM 14239 = ACAM 615]|uniref:Uncharacterized protein n=1 Tax=Brumicola pallidula DSM 14239 = ACAM 615 TaxID=1121922 RepID=K6Z2G1_9ALTE|nr:hypothetical protein GPAL_3535 [Glaciecola pallidula DSM 14239 = ACAM 615]